MVISDEALAYALAGMENGGMVAAAESLANRLQRKVRQLACKVDSDLTGPSHTCPAAGRDASGTIS